MAEEHRCQAQKLCANNCGFFGSPAMQDLCSKCYRDLHLDKHRPSSTPILLLNQSLSTAPSGNDGHRLLTSPSFLPEPSSTAAPAEDAREEESRMALVPGSAKRCCSCRRRVGLTGFRCRCGFTFCGTHRYPELHGCGFDFKSFGREEIKKANPVIKADKLHKI
ncbi:hypothetical protein MLD38_017239 [Melastoma candidum]|uniref:Uncharacterized protein n=1 Tax=Melastoma candidum TaxID=119954 RepID=A0ACB9QQ60_9MYRT|nr:hypothetical protein MLD38_017239 [Melastoma candidum]